MAVFDLYSDADELAFHQKLSKVDWQGGEGWYLDELGPANRCARQSDSQRNKAWTSRTK